MSGPLAPKWCHVPRLAAAVLFLGGCERPPTTATITMAPTTLRHEVSAEGVLETSKVTPVTLPSGSRGRFRLAWLADEGTLVEAGEVVARFDDADLLDQLSSGQADLRSKGLEMAKARATQSQQTAEIDSDYEVAGLEVEVAERFQLTDDEVFSRQEIIESQIDGELATARRDHAAFALEAVASTSQAALAILEIQRGEANRRIELATEGLGSLEVRAPHAGLFLHARDWRLEPIQVGAEMWAGGKVGEIPDPAGLEVEAHVLEADAGGLEAGKTATLVVEAHPGKRYKATIGRVDTLARPRRRGSPVQYFGVTLKFEDAPDAWLKPGQRAVAKLLLEIRENVLTLPRQAVVPAGDGYVAYRWAEGTFDPVPIALGKASTGLVEIVEGLEAGDVVALEPPTDDRALAAGGAP